MKRKDNEEWGEASNTILPVAIVLTRFLISTSSSRTQAGAEEGCSSNSARSAHTFHNRMGQN